ncbi:MAG: sigma 54-interacting transcriptional regulator [Myxococcales bacterium]|nr:sigma 54-interacting transcriptional regulator [Myxococcales bacterium]
MELVNLHITVIDGDESALQTLKTELAAAFGASLRLARFTETTAGLDYVGLHAPDILILGESLVPDDRASLVKKLRGSGFAGAFIALAQESSDAVPSFATDTLLHSEMTAPLLRRSVRYCLSKMNAARELQRSRNALEAADALVHALESAADDGILTVAADGEIRRVNDRAEQIFGEGRTSLVGRHITVLLPWARDGLPGKQQAQRSALQPAPRRTVEGMRAGGERFSLALTATAVSSGPAPMSILVVHDLTEAREAQAEEEERQTAQDSALSVVTSLRVAAVVLDEDGVVALCNPAARRLLERQDLVGIHWTAVGELDATARAALRTAMAAPASMNRRVPLRLTVQSGRQLELEIDVHDAVASPHGRVMFLHEVSGNAALHTDLEGRLEFPGLIGHSAQMDQVFELIRDISPVDVTVLIEGETGTGKELVARAIHAASPRAEQPYVVVNCAGLSDSLLSSQLFGHVRGSFTGAVSDHKGVFEAAHGGTIFLDEIGDVSPRVQTSLLRVLQEREVTRLGESAPRRINVRIIAATHRDLNADVASGRFRLDLLYRLRVARIAVPPLRARPSDVPLLARWFLRQVCGQTGKQVDGIGEDAMRQLALHTWPGNVRELRSAIAFAVVRSKGGLVRSADLPAETLGGGELGALSERDRVLEALQRAGFNRTAAARLMGLSRATFYRRLTEFDIDLSGRR